MDRTASFAALASGALISLILALVPLSPLAGQAEPNGLWSTSYSAGQSLQDCENYRLDDNDFCVANDSRNGLELGVKFQTSRELLVTGVRIYRVDTDAVTASLWTSDGTRLATSDFSPMTGNGWQDVFFADPVTIVPGSTYVASYFTPQTKYAFSYEYFAGSELTVGPITALRSVDGDPNGVHCYDDAQCGSFPVRGFRDTNYWVTPLWQGSELDSTPTGTPTATGTPTVDRKPPRVTSLSPARGARGVRVGKTVKVTFSEAIRRATLTSSSVRLVRMQGSTRVAAKLTYHAASRVLALDPRSPLRPATTYRVVITTSVRDTSGNRFDQFLSKAGRQAAKWTFGTK